MVKEAGADDRGLLFAVADLNSDDGWREAAAGVSHVIHVASPFPAVQPENEDDLIVPAREGTLRVLRAARAERVRRVVLTSSFAAVGYGHGNLGRPVTEEDWTNLEAPGLSPYVKSKTLAEKAAWDFVADGGPELSVINPVGIFGPVLGTDLSTSIHLVRELLKGAMPALPKAATNLVDVRDVADLHLEAMTSPAAAGERFIAVAGPPMLFPEIAAVMKQTPYGAKVPTKTIPDWVIRGGAPFVGRFKEIKPLLNRRQPASNEKAERVLGWSPMSNEQTLIATAESLHKHGLI